MQRYGMTIPFGLPLAEQEDLIKEMVDLGYTDFWSSESNGSDGFTPLVQASIWAPTARLGIAIIPAYTRGPALMAQTVGAMAEAAPGRFVMGIGTSSNVIVEQWNDIPFERPYYKTRDMVRFLKKALTGDRIDEEFETFNVRGFRMGRPLKECPPILVAALRQGMLRMAGREGDGAILNWLSPDDVKTVVPYVHEAGPGKEIAARIFVIATEDKGVIDFVGKRSMAAYLNVPVYAAFHEWLGRRDVLGPMWDAWAAGDRKKALEVIPEEALRDILIIGSPGKCRERIQEYIEAGVHTPAIQIMHPGDDLRETIRALAPG